MCSGKTLVADLFLKNKPNCFRVSVDKIKWLISDYSLEKYGQTGVTHRITFKLATAAAAEGLSLVIESNPRLMVSWRPQYTALAKKYQLNFFEVNLEAPHEVLKQRFVERVARAERERGHISIKDEAGMEARYDAYISLRNPNVPTFDSSLMSTEEIVSKLDSLID